MNDQTPDLRAQLLDALDFAYCQGLGYDTPEALLAAYDAACGAVPVPPPADQTALRQRIAGALYERERPPRDPAWAEAFAMDREVFEAMADAVLAVLPEHSAAGLAAIRPQTLTALASHIDARAVAILRSDSQTYAEWQAMAALLRRVAAEEQPAETQDALTQARATNQRLNLRAQALESELATYRRAVAQWEVSDHRTYVPMRSLAAIAKAAGRDIETPHWLLHYQRVEQAEAAIERVRALREPIAEAIEQADYSGNMRRGDLADSVMPVIHAALDATARPAVGEQPETQEAPRG